MKITKEWLEKKKACSEAVAEFTEKWPKEIAVIPALKRLMKEEKFAGNWKVWQANYQFCHL